MTEMHLLRCVVVSVATDGDEASESAAMTVARRFGARCRAILVESSDLANGAQTAFGRVLDPRSGRWQPTEPEDLQQAMAEDVSRRLRRLKALAETAGLEADIAIQRVGAAVSAMREGSADELVVLAVPADPLARQTQPFTALRTAALEGPAGVVFVPPAPANEASGIVVIAGGPDDPAIQVAREIAKAAGEDVDVLMVTGEAGSAPLSLPVLVSEIEIRLSRPPALIIATHDAATSDPVALTRFAARLVAPVLLIEPAETEADPK